MIPAWLVTTLSIINYIAVALAIAHVLRYRRDPRGMFAWVLILFFLPLVGLFLFLTVGNMPVKRRVKRFEKRTGKIASALARQTAVVREQFDERQSDELDEDMQRLIEFAYTVTGSVVSSGNQVILSHDAEKTFLEKQLIINSAKSSVHLQYYIYADDETGRALSQLLIDRAKAGVEVRLLLDAVGCWRLPRRHVNWLKDNGVQIAFFMPWRPTRRRLQLNCRNHRKLVVADGKRAITGSSNIANEYLGSHPQLGPWEDTNLFIKGPAVTKLQEVFAEDWVASTKEELTTDRYFPDPEAVGNQAVQIVASGPTDVVPVMHQLLYAALSNARHAVSFITPYFVPDQAMMLALTSAAYRGVRVRMLVPSRTDHPVVLWAGRSNYQELLDAGVEILEYPHGMLHSKTVAIDGRWGMIGSANMDVRSFRINFELTTLLYDDVAANTLKKDFQRLAQDSIAITSESVESWSLKEQIYAGLARMTSPMM